MAKKTTKDAKGFDGMFETTTPPETTNQDETTTTAESEADTLEDTPKKKRKSPKGPQAPNEEGKVRYTFLIDADSLNTIKSMAKLTGRTNSDTLNAAINFYLSKKWTDGHKTAAAQLKRMLE